MLADLKSVEFSYEELAEATNDFNLSYKIGQGGFASVYYGVIRNQVSSFLSSTNTAGASVYSVIIGVSPSPLRHIYLSGKCWLLWIELNCMVHVSDLELKSTHIKYWSINLQWSILAASVCMAVACKKPQGVLHIVSIETISFIFDMIKIS